MTFYEIKLNVVIDRNTPKALMHLKSTLEEMFEKNRHLNTGNVNLLNIEEKKKKIDPLPREPFTRFSNIQVIKKSSDNEIGLFRSSAIF